MGVCMDEYMDVWMNMCMDEYMDVFGDDDQITSSTSSFSVKRETFLLSALRAFILM